MQSLESPIGSQYNGYSLNKAPVNWILDPVQYQVKEINYSGNKPSNYQFEHTGIPEYTTVKRSVNDLTTQSYRRFQANTGDFNPNEAKDNSDLWYYSTNGGASLNVQEYQHIIFPESQRGGLNTKNMVKYSWNDSNKCQLFNYNSKNNLVPGPGLGDSVNNIYSFDSNYVRNVLSSNPREGSMPYPNNMDDNVQPA